MQLDVLRMIAYRAHGIANLLDRGVELLRPGRQSLFAVHINAFYGLSAHAVLLNVGLLFSKRRACSLAKVRNLPRACMKPISPEPDSPEKIRWLARCAIKIRENKPELTRDEAIAAADEIWTAAHASMTPEQAADMASSLIERMEMGSTPDEGEDHEN